MRKLRVRRSTNMNLRGKVKARSTYLLSLFKQRVELRLPGDRDGGNRKKFDRVQRSRLINNSALFA